MPKITFLPQQATVDVNADSKVLAAAIKNKIPIRFGCGACRCGTCGIAVDHANSKLSPIDIHEKAMLERIGLPTDGSVRLACKTKIIDGHLVVDLDFQDTYSPGEDFEEQPT